MTVAVRPYCGYFICLALVYMMNGEEKNLNGISAGKSWTLYFQYISSAKDNQREAQINYRVI